ncbi:MAG: aminotransferase class III-fold pyridoxal phosphate-dependent enzyme [Planctomycetota bacterium]|nr:aminotransferase class III-fold pyridoxal phosphate-dependent enzyme [Planctomycetota bacterium]
MASALMPTYRPGGTAFSSGAGASLFDAEGKEWIDLLSGLGVTVLGHSHPRWVAAVQEQAAHLVHTSNLYPQAPAEEVAERLCDLTGMDSVFFSNSGTEAVECALKLARKAAGQRRPQAPTHFLAIEGSFHGRSLGSLSVTSNPGYRIPFAPTLEAHFVERDSLKDLEQAFAQGSPAALIVEPIQGEGGLHVLEGSFLRRARELCDQTGTVLISDEVQCGLGRSGPFLAYAAAGVLPDVVTLAKPLAGGLSVGATLACADLSSTLQPGDHGSTFGGGPLVMTAARVVLDELTHGGLLEELTPKAEYLTAGLDDLVGRHDAATERRGRHWMQGLVLPGQAVAAQQGLADRGFLAGTAAGDVLRFLPPYVLTHEQLERALAALDETLTTLPQPQALPSIP